jgi:ABC-type Fe3+ transport system permease subunit
MRRPLAITILVLLLVAGSAAVHARTKKRPHKSRAVATKPVAEPTVRTPPEPIAEPIAPLPVLLTVLAGMVAIAFVSLVGALSRAREVECESPVLAHASVHSRPVRSAGVAVARSFQVNSNQFEKARLVSFP